MTNQPATTEQLTQLRRHAVNDVTCEIMRVGVILTHDQADDLGKETLDWISARLGLNVRETDRGVECTPPVHYVGTVGGQLVTASEAEEIDEADEVREVKEAVELATDDEIEKLATAAGEAGDLVQVALCRLALGWSYADIHDHDGMAVTDKLDAWAHPWANQIRASAREARDCKLARVLCGRAIADAAAQS